MATDDATDGTLTATSEPSSTIDIYPNGDAILICGARFGNGKTTRFRVSSAAPAMGSPVMRALFKPHFKEGTDLRASEAGQSLEIAPPEDNPFAVEVICNILHLQNDKVDTSDSFSVASILEVAKASSKYGCEVALMYPARRWLNRDARTGRDHTTLFAAS
ncbi:Putative SKP1/BTB/POZ domain superfamily protein [Septoria linicola]|uniref:SKP1/BTB/POZ domain superfamily protein n=1 Tax=Septoria linicola TaxID=215465 RepID=A0A9Q9AUN6_9PEZI|nr:Putative SKP1/BTB/POZ domain superfamily protein [Septoria linicola]